MDKTPQNLDGRTDPKNKDRRMNPKTIDDRMNPENTDGGINSQNKDDRINPVLIVLVLKNNYEQITEHQSGFIPSENILRTGTKQTEILRKWMPY